MRFLDRSDAGKKLAEKLHKYAGSDPVVFGLPRGGIILADEVSKKLSAYLDIIMVRKLGHPQHEEYAIGGVAEDEPPLYNPAEKSLFNEDILSRSVQNARRLIKKRRSLYLGKNYHPPSLKNKTAIIVDDGIATGLTMLAAVEYIRKKKPAKIVVAAPVGSSESIKILGSRSDEIVLLDDPENFLGAVGAHYFDFKEVSDEEVISMLKNARITESRWFLPTAQRKEQTSDN